MRQHQEPGRSARKYENRTSYIVLRTFNRPSDIMKVLFLGSGTSTGVPVIGCRCKVCTSADPRNKRLRSSVLVSSGKTTLLVDSGPDLRAQALRAGFTAIDAILYTHEHLDHVAGFDDLRAFCWEREDLLPLYAGEGCLARLRAMYPWALAAEQKYRGYVRARCICHGGKPFRIGDIEVQPVPVLHATVETYGYVFRSSGRSFGYVPDIKRLPEASVPLLRGLDALAMDGLCYPQHPTHLSVDENVALMRELSPKRGFVTHSGHRLEYNELAAYLPAFMAPAYDGLEIQL